MTIATIAVAGFKAPVVVLEINQGNIEVVKGKDVVKKIENTKTARGNRPVSEQKIIKAYVKN